MARDDHVTEEEQRPAQDTEMAAQGTEMASLPKATRLRSTLLATLAELDRGDLDAAALRRLVQLHRDTLVEVASAVSDPLIAELVTLGMEPLRPGASEAEVRVAHAQLTGWVHGLLAGMRSWPDRPWDPDSEGTSYPGPGR
jgi:hypothetical protein